MRAGDLDQRITLLRLVETESADGGVDAAWRVLRAVWAQPMEGASKEYVAGNATTEQKRVSFRVRYAADIEALATALRIDWRGLRYDVEGMTGSLRLSELRLQCLSVGKAP
jgi:SPP1 family predicted phage head-tail adaptor